MPIAAPTILHAAHDHVWLAWAPVANGPGGGGGTYSYEVLQHSTDERVPHRALNPAAASWDTSVRVGGLRPGGTYEFAVRATSLHSRPRQTMVSPPSRPVVLAEGPDVLLLVGHLPLHDGDALLERHLQGLGLRTRSILESDEMPCLADSAPLRWPNELPQGAVSSAPRLLVISPSCRAQSMAEACHATGVNPLRMPWHLALPALVLSRAAWHTFGAAGSSVASSVVAGLESDLARVQGASRVSRAPRASWATLQPVTHPMRAGLPPGTT